MKKISSFCVPTTVGPIYEWVGKLGVSVHWLKTGFINEVKAAGFDINSDIYEIEDLRGSTPGVIRRKGQNVMSPIDGRMGASYVHSLSGEDNVGTSTFMLSYSWGYTVGDIISTLDTYCHEHNHNPKCTYVWICCLCINQHRVVEDLRNGINVPFEIFYDVFRKRVEGIGHVLCMMQPFSKPLYRKRVWCIFEIFVAIQHGCIVSIVMPPSEREALHVVAKGSIIFGCDDNDDEQGKAGHHRRRRVVDAAAATTLFDGGDGGLANTNVEKAEASVDDDKVKILNLVEKGVGCRTLNNRVNELLRQWARDEVQDNLF